MDFFKLIEGSAVLLYSAGVYKQVEVYHRGKDVYAKTGGGFILLAGFRATSQPRTSWQAIKADGVSQKGANAPVYNEDVA